jgi:hypothetical protein
MDLTAIDVLLDPDHVMVEQALAANAALRTNFSSGFALDGDHAPHITVLQRFVRTSDLTEALSAVAEAVAPLDWATMRLEATGYYYLPMDGLGLAGITVATTPTLLDLQATLIGILSPYSEPQADRHAFVDAPDSPTIGLTADYIAAFVAEHAGARYNPHVTVGVGTRTYVDALVHAPFDRFTFGIEGAAVYQLGDLGTAQRKLWPDTGSPTPG